MCEIVEKSKAWEEGGSDDRAGNGKEDENDKSRLSFSSGSKGVQSKMYPT